MSADDGLRALLKKHLTPLGFETIAVESGGSTSGLPDVRWMHRDRRLCGWVECKATTGWAVKMRPHQVGFLTRAEAAGDRGVVAVRARGAGSAAGHGDALWLLESAGARALTAGGLDAAGPHVLLTQYGPPRSWDWRAVADVLLRD